MLFIIAINWLIRSGRLNQVISYFRNTYQLSCRINFKIALVFFIAILSNSATGKPSDKTTETLPVPTGIKNQLFYLQRDPDANTVVYKLNMRDGKLDVNEPVSAFWIRYAEEGQIKALSSIQRRFAYGIQSKLVEKGKHELRLTSYPKMPLYLIRSNAANQYHVYAIIEQRQLILNRIFVRIKGGTLYLPKVIYIELSGKDAYTGTDIIHRIIV